MTSAAAESNSWDGPDEIPANARQDSKRREINLLNVAWRSRWLIVLGMVLGLAGGWFALQQVVPRFTSMSRIYVERNLPALLSREYQVGQSASYLFTQAELIRSTSVLAIAAEAPDNANLESFRGVDNRVGFLKECIQVAVGNQDDIINIWAELPHARDAAQLVNSVVDAYVTKYAEQRESSTAEVLSILRGEKERRDAELEKRRQALQDYREQHAELAVQFNSENVVTRRFSTLAETLNQTELALIEATALYNRGKAMYESPSQRVNLLEMANSQPEMLDDSGLKNRAEQLELALTSERAQWGEGHPKVRLLRDSLAELRKRLQETQQVIIDGYIEKLRQEYELLVYKRNELQREYDSQFQRATAAGTQSLQMASLVEAYQRTEKLCDILDERIKEVNLSDEVGAMNVSIMEVAVPSMAASSPNRSRFLASGLLLGALTGFGLAWLRELLDHRLRSIDEVASTLQLPVLGTLPFLGDQNGKSPVGQMVASDPHSPFAEAIRTLRTALHFGLGGEKTRTIVVTSPAPGDGKSTVASNLAIALSLADQRVLIIDADLRKPTLHNVFQVSSQVGLASVLAERRPVREAILTGVVGSLDLLPCGKLPANPVELLNNGFFAELLEELKESYDKIVIDSPPVLPVADSRVIAAISDATILVLNIERTTRRVGLAARNELWGVRANRLGVVVNGVPTRKHGDYYGYGYGYGSYGNSESTSDTSSKRRSGSRSREAISAVASEPVES